MPEEIPGKMFTAEETNFLRRKYIEKKIIPALQKRFELFPQLRSAALFVAQYWDDEANDAVHPWWLFSVLETPDIAAAFRDENYFSDPVNLPGHPRHWDLNWKKGEPLYPWDDNGIVIPIFAAFCREGCHQQMTEDEAYSLFAIFRKIPTGFEVEYCGEMIRPWLDGVYPENYETHIQPEDLKTLRNNWFEFLEDRDWR